MAVEFWGRHTPCDPLAPHVCMLHTLCPPTRSAISMNGAWPMLPRPLSAAAGLARLPAERVHCVCCWPTQFHLHLTVGISRTLVRQGDGVPGGFRPFPGLASQSPAWGTPPRKRAPFPPLCFRLSRGPTASHPLFVLVPQAS